MIFVPSGLVAILPGPLKGMRHKRTSFFNGVILATYALGFLPGALSAQRPLLLQLAHFGHLIDSGDGNLDLI